MVARGHHAQGRSPRTHALRLGPHDRPRRHALYRPWFAREETVRRGEAVCQGHTAPRLNGQSVGPSPNLTPLCTHRATGRAVALSHPASPRKMGVPAPALAPRGEPCKPGSARSSGEGSGALRQARCRGHGLQPSHNVSEWGPGRLLGGEPWSPGRSGRCPGPGPPHRAPLPLCIELCPRGWRCGGHGLRPLRQQMMPSRW